MIPEEIYEALDMGMMVMVKYNQDIVDDVDVYCKKDVLYEVISVSKNLETFEVLVEKPFMLYDKFDEDWDGIEKEFFVV